MLVEDLFLRGLADGEEARTALEGWQWHWQRRRMREIGTWLRHGCYVVVKGERVRLEVETWSPWHQVCGTGLGYLEIKGKLV